MCGLSIFKCEDVFVYKMQMVEHGRLFRSYIYFLADMKIVKVTSMVSPVKMYMLTLGKMFYT